MCVCKYVCARARTYAYVSMHMGGWGGWGVGGGGRGAVSKAGLLKQPVASILSRK